MQPNQVLVTFLSYFHMEFIYVHGELSGVTEISPDGEKSYIRNSQKMGFKLYLTQKLETELPDKRQC